MNLPTDSSNELIIKEFELVAPDADAPSEEVLFQMLCDRISWLIEHNMEYLMSLLYRNDVLERKIQDALLPGNPDPANVGSSAVLMPGSVGINLLLYEIVDHVGRPSNVATAEQFDRRG